jgi:hypothetical protein
MQPNGQALAVSQHHHFAALANFRLADGITPPFRRNNAAVQEGFGPR